MTVRKFCVALLKFLQRFVASKKSVVRKATSYNPNSRFGALIWKYIVYPQTAFPEFKGYPVTDGSDPAKELDDHVVADATRRFKVSLDSGCDYLSSEAPLDDSAHQLRIERRLVDAGVLYFCPGIGCFMIDTKPVTACSECGYGIEDDEILVSEEDGYGQFDDAGVCDGPCGQTSCTCAELEALGKHNADPHTRGSWFVA